MLEEAISYSIDVEASVKIVQVTDPHLFADHDAQLLGVNTAQSLRAVLNTIDAVHYPADFMLASGDISQDYSAESYHNFVKAISPLGLPCHYLPGNHDDPRIMRLNMQGPKIFGHRRILVGSWQVIMLDSTVRGKPGGYMSDAEFELIKAAAEDQPDRHILLAMHHNPILVGCAWLDQHWMSNGSEFLELVAKIPQVKGLLWGHVHQQIDQEYSGHHGPIKLMATPSTCIQFKPKSSYFALDAVQPGYRLLELKADGNILTNVYRVPGELFSPDKSASGY
ncbi:3',5'-cyclic-AMP phosphodiesterase [Shewanella woodyi]|uniref:3',5'-cyclic adenosine monophosphate phosphodiesterase CpdA n=1 Tax=Shewanella woodyi (strain ATCC 51908 / MS32) TaxID=392500 RepID=B1KHX0_SHEWM|nr:3',5'-cyclic-AMP phosphodiesterase [Shewanella woodyi]ACA88448.1 Calcineurin phosphoesterase domain protein [Shewanella woodyi ATCC 51908]